MKQESSVNYSSMVNFNVSVGKIMNIIQHDSTSKMAKEDNYATN